MHIEFSVWFLFFFFPPLFFLQLLRSGEGLVSKDPSAGWQKFLEAA